MIPLEHTNPDLRTLECIADLVDGSFDHFELVHFVTGEELEVHQETHHQVTVCFQLDDVGCQLKEYVVGSCRACEVDVHLSVK